MVIASKLRRLFRRTISGPSHGEDLLRLSLERNSKRPSSPDAWPCSMKPFPEEASMGTFSADTGLLLGYTPPARPSTPSCYIDREPYSYKALEENEIRLFVMEVSGHREDEIIGRITTTNLRSRHATLTGSMGANDRQDTCRLYTCLTYAWGPMRADGSHLSHPIVCDGYKLQVSSSLFQALRRIRNAISVDSSWMEDRKRPFVVKDPLTFCGQMLYALTSTTLKSIPPKSKRWVKFTLSVQVYLSGWERGTMVSLGLLNESFSTTI